MNRRDWLMLVLGAADGKQLSPVQLQKALFLIGRERKEDVGEDFYKFKAYDYGPFCADIYSDAEALREEGLVAIDNPTQHGWRRYSVTSAGVGRAKELEKKLSRGTRKYLAEQVAWVLGKDFAELVRAIYNRYPEFKERSVFRG